MTSKGRPLPSIPSPTIQFKTTQTSLKNGPSSNPPSNLNSPVINNSPLALPPRTKTVRGRNVDMRKSVYNNRKQLMSVKLVEAVPESELERMNTEVDELYQCIISQTSSLSPDSRPTSLSSPLSSPHSSPRSSPLSTSQPITEESYLSNDVFEYDERFEMNDDAEKVIEELLSTEKNYVNNLGFVINKYIYPLRKQQILPASDINQIFTNMEGLITINSTLLSKFNGCFNDISKICEAFNDQKNNLENGYCAYCNQQSDADEKLKILRKKHSTFGNFLLEVKKDPHSRSLDLVDFLFAPLQRITKYPLLFSSLKKNLPNTSNHLPLVEESIKISKEIVSKVNQSRNAFETKKKISELLKIVSGSELLNLSSTGRFFIRNGPLDSIKKGKTDSVMCWLFNDILIFAKKIKKLNLNKEGFELRGVIPLWKMIFKDLPDSPNLKCAWSLSRVEPDKNYIFSCATTKSKLTWLQAIQEALDSDGPEDEESNSKFFRMIELSLNLDGFDKIPKSSKNRSILIEGTLWDMDNLNNRKEPISLYGFVCDDIFIYTVQKGSKYALKDCIPLNNALVVSQQDARDGKFYTFEIARYDQKTKLTLAANTLEKKKQWLTILDKIINENLAQKANTQDAKFIKAARLSYAKLVPRQSFTSDEDNNQQEVMGELNKMLTGFQVDQINHSQPLPSVPSSGNPKTQNNTLKFNSSLSGKTGANFLKKNMGGSVSMKDLRRPTTPTSLRRPTNNPPPPITTPSTQNQDSGTLKRPSNPPPPPTTTSSTNNTFTQNQDSGTLKRPSNPPPPPTTTPSTQNQDSGTLKRPNNPPPPPTTTSSTQNQDSGTLKRPSNPPPPPTTTSSTNNTFTQNQDSGTLKRPNNPPPPLPATTSSTNNTFTQNQEEQTDQENNNNNNNNITSSINEFFSTFETLKQKLDQKNWTQSNSQKIEQIQKDIQNLQEAMNLLSSQL